MWIVCVIVSLLTCLQFYFRCTGKFRKKESLWCHCLRGASSSFVIEIFERNLWNSNKQNETLSSSDIRKLSANYTVVHEAVKIYIFKDSSAILEQVEQFSRNDRNKWIEWYRNKIANRVISQCFIWHKYTKVQYSEFTEWKLWDICKLAWDTIFLRQETKFSLKLNCETNPKS